VRDHFIAANVTGGRGIDVGSGTNLYPAMAMLPFCRELELRDFAPPNVEWLRSQLHRYDDHWDEFWAVYRSRGAYAKVNNPRLTLAKRAKVRHASVFDLPPRLWTWARCSSWRAPFRPTWRSLIGRWCGSYDRSSQTPRCAPRS
jgi:hypothetical protein